MVKNATNDELKKAIELKNSTQAILKRCVDLKIPLDSNEKKKKAEKTAVRLNQVIDSDKPGTSKSKCSDVDLEEPDDKKRRLLELLKVYFYIRICLKLKFINLFKFIKASTGYKS